VEKVDPGLEKEISTGMLLKFALPTVLTYMFMGTFGIVDGVFVSRILGEHELAAVSLVTPFIMFVLALGTMFGAGGNALVAKEIGEGKIEWARQDFTLVIIMSFLVMFVLALIGGFFPDLVLVILGVDSDVYHLALAYFMPLVVFLPFAGAGIMFQIFLITEGKAHLGMIATIVGGSVSIFLNWLLLYRLHWGLEGAALSTSLGYAIPAVFGIVYFSINKKRGGLLYFVKPRFKPYVLVRSCLNGMSEMVTMMASAITSVFMNNILMDMDGPMAVAAAGIMMAMFSTTSSIFGGYAAGVSPLISYNYGKRESARLKKIFRSSLWIVSIMSLGTTVFSWIFTDLFISIFLRDVWVYIGGFILLLPVYEMAFNGVRMIGFGYIFMGINMFGSMLYTAFNNARESTVISLLRGIVFFMATLALLPMIMGINGVWIAMPVADALTVVFTVCFFIRFRKKYQYA
jgi:Na+-driven multidrug efflux pump